MHRRCVGDRREDHQIEPGDEEQPRNLGDVLADEVRWLAQARRRLPLEHNSLVGLFVLILCEVLSLCRLDLCAEDGVCVR